MPFRWFAVMISVSALLLSSGCSLVAKEWMDLSQEQLAEQQKKEKKEKQPDEDDSTEVEPEPQAPTNAEGTDPLIKGKELEVSKITILADDQDWKKASYESEDEEHEFTAFTPDGESPDQAEEMLGVHYFPGLQEEATVSQTAMLMKEGMEEESEGSLEWEVLSQDREDQLVGLKISDPAEEDIEGLARFFATDDGIYMVMYLNAYTLNDSEKKEWLHLLKQANNTDLTL
ncbi:hypothetical protein JOD24_002693 [Kroppenstedtia sanguinis]|uniref:Uncharacterized protein n=1 Tax=Kroppenstedtia sanguinis TaxID=1380684 RepID=A0ABW4C8J1_9BACL